MRPNWINKAYITFALVAINCIVFVILEIMGDTQNSEFMASMGAVWPPYILEQGQYWRLLTATFMHFGFDHILNNMLILICAGIILEDALGHVKYLILYLIAGIGGSRCIRGNIWNHRSLIMDCNRT